MNWEVIKELGINSTDLAEVIELLDELQLDITERLENVADEDRKKELTEKLKLVEVQLTEARKALKSGGGSSQKKNVPISSNGENAKNHKVIPIVSVPKTSKDDSLKYHEKELSKKAADVRKNYADKIKRSEESKKASDVTPAGKGDDTKPQNGREEPYLTKKQPHQPSSKPAEKQSAEQLPQAKKSGSGNDLYTSSIKAYNAKSYDEAFAGFSRIANDPKVELSKKEEGRARYCLGAMYEKSLGMTSPDMDRAEFWYKESEKLGDPAGSLAYAILLMKKKPKSADEAGRITDTVLSSLTKAIENAGDDPDYQAERKIALGQYVEYCETHSVSKSQYKTALKYLSMLEAMETDAYVKSKYKERENALIEKSKSAQNNKAPAVPLWNKKFNGKFDVFEIIGRLLNLIGFLIIMGNSFVVFGDEFFGIDFIKIIPNIPYLLPGYYKDFLFARHVQEETFAGFTLIIIASVPISLFRLDNRGTVSAKISNAISVLTCIVVIFGVILLTINGAFSRGELWTVGLVIMATMIVCRIPGWIVEFFADF